ncbi:hypothetical protein GNE08_12595 [Trichormus variabilis ARAD]|uniref:Uncharacterized protein n=1 Tax=Trichormus variabilis N2B TaxID=2681315 RepID=A0ABR6SBR8_ANAVA|nr:MULTISPECIES: hypothetical protein [Nostocaceae]MBC1215058.1 hypothetical protein [Trichormus variabilis ARAD]MBC1254981.1 hypothetical protein [Trichormus variabilis V5]MBC1267961.1 hypothetical protein [Trichormus variabilis FSR]MBC1303729.1 hypothetical protein [Trichormus variabilis N2B]MBC1312008.1 hypothetical protein [Trichormus variabilis PNB]
MGSRAFRKHAKVLFTLWTPVDSVDNPYTARVLACGHLWTWGVDTPLSVDTVQQQQQKHHALLRESWCIVGLTGLWF